MAIIKSPRAAPKKPGSPGAAIRLAIATPPASVISAA